MSTKIVKGKYLWGLFQNRRTLGQMLQSVWKGHYKMSLLTYMVLIAGICYVLFPFDIIADLIPFIGWIDDGVVLLLVYKRLISETQRYIRFKANNRRCQ